MYYVRRCALILLGLITETILRHLIMLCHCRVQGIGGRGCIAFSIHKCFTVCLGSTAAIYADLLIVSLVCT